MQIGVTTGYLTKLITGKNTLDQVESSILPTQDKVSHVKLTLDQVENAMQSFEHFTSTVVLAIYHHLGLA